jgi:hypothetical protein
MRQMIANPSVEATAKRSGLVRALANPAAAFAQGNPANVAGGPG